MWQAQLGNWISAFAGDMWSLYKQNEDQNFQSASQDKNMAFQREMAQHGVRWRAEDAARAGVHPLYAMGGAFPSGAPIHVGGSDAPLGAGARSLVGTFGQKDAGRREMTEDERALYNANLEEIRSRTEVNYAERVRLDSEAMKNYQDAVGRSPTLSDRAGKGGDSGVVTFSNQQLLPGNRDVIEMNPPQRYSERSDEGGVASGAMTGTEVVRIPSPVNRSDTIDVVMPFSPGQGPWEAWGELDFATKALFIRLNHLRDPGVASRLWNEVVMGRRMPPADRSGVGEYKADAFRRRNRIRY